MTASEYILCLRIVGDCEFCTTQQWRYLMSLDRIILKMMFVTIFIRLCFLCLYKREVDIAIYVLDFVEIPLTGGLRTIFV